MTRTKSPFFDDDVIDTFADGDPFTAFSINTIVARWRNGKAGRDIARKAILQAFASRAVVKKEHGGWTNEEIKAIVLLLQQRYPDLWKSTPEEPQCNITSQSP